MNKVGKNYLIGGIVSVLILVGVAFWMKSDADAKAASYEKAKQALAVDYKRDVNMLRLSDKINHDIPSTPEEAKLERGICNTAATLSARIEKLKTDRLKGSIGSVLSANYKKAQTSANNKNIIDALKTYETTCDYNALGTEQQAEIITINDSPEYKKLIDFTSAGCMTESGCVHRENYDAFAVLYDKKVSINKKYVDIYNKRPCPLTVAKEQPICDALKKYIWVLYDDSVKYVAALRSGNRDQLNQTVAAGQSRPEFDRLNAVVTKIDPSSDTINAFWSKLMLHQEEALRKTSL